MIGATVILTAEDDADIRRIMARTLTGEGHRVVETPDGELAFQMVRECRPDLVVTDGQMPRMTGYELCRRIKAIPDLAHIPVLIVTGSLTPAQVEAGVPWASGYLVKPFTPRLLIDAVRSLLPAPTRTVPVGLPADWCGNPSRAAIRV